MAAPHEDLATAEAVSAKLQEARQIADRYSKEDLRMLLDTTIANTDAEIRALRNIVGPHER